jgi:hypothetical protein
MWPDRVHLWLISPLRETIMHQLFVFLAVAGFACAAYGTRLVFFALLSVGGLAELGATTAAWLIPLLATVFSCGLGRLVQSRQIDPWAHARKTSINATLAVLYFPVSVIAFLVGENQSPPPVDRISIELDRETAKIIDDRLTAFGMPPLDPPRSFPPIFYPHPHPLDCSPQGRMRA